MIIVPDYSKEALTDNLPVAVKEITSKNLIELADKVLEEAKETVGMALYSKIERNVESELKEDTKMMLAKECVDVIFAANTLLASLYMDVDDRNKIFNDVYKKNEERGYYDMPRCREEGPDKVLRDYSIVEFADRHGIIKDKVLFELLKAIVEVADGKCEDE